MNAGPQKPNKSPEPMNDPRESDWKKFRAMLPVWRERYLAGRNPRIAAVLLDVNKTETDRFWAAEKLIEKEARVLQRCLDDIRRSRMWERLAEMRAAGMIRRDDLAEFSPELQEQVFYEFPEQKKANRAPEPTLIVRPFSFMTAVLETPSSRRVSAAHLRR